MLEGGSVRGKTTRVDYDTIVNTCQASPNKSFVVHSIRVLVAALTRPAMSEALTESPAKLLFATSLVECLLHAFQGEIEISKKSSSSH